MGQEREDETEDVKNSIAVLNRGHLSKDWRDLGINLWVLGKNIPSRGNSSKWEESQWC